MKSMMNKAAAALTRSVMVLACCVMAGLGLAFVGMVALFALSAGVLALLVAPFARRAVAAHDAAETAEA